MRALTQLDLWCLGVNAIVGSSIFLFPGKLAAMLGAASPAAFLVTGALLAPVALCFAEAGSRFDGHGGPYLYARAAFGPRVGFAVGWLCWSAEILTWAAVANGLGPYLGWFDGRLEGPVAGKLAAAAVILTMGAVNLRGVKPGARTSNAFTFAKLVPLLALVVAGAPLLPAAGFDAPQGWGPLGSACFLAYFAFQGFEVVPVPAGEARAASRHVPRAVLGSLGAATALYALVQAVAVAAEPGLAASSRPLADAAGRLMGPFGAALVAAGALVSMIGFNAGCALGGPRYLIALAEHGDMPRPATDFRRAVAVTTGLTLLAALCLDFERLVDIGNVVIGAQYLAACAAVLALREKSPAPFQAPGGSLIPVAGALATLWLCSQGGWSQVGATLAVLGLGFLVRRLIGGKR